MLVLLAGLLGSCRPLPDFCYLDEPLLPYPPYRQGYSAPPTPDQRAADDAAYAAALEQYRLDLEAYNDWHNACASSWFDVPADPLPTCGSGFIQGLEPCDGNDLDGQTCISLGYTSGELACASSCDAFDTSNCLLASCGNTNVDGPEICDGLNLDGEDCVSLGFDHGDLFCAPNCQAFDTAACVTAACGNGDLEGDEFCELNVHGGEDCVSLGFASGTLACASDCNAFDTSGCSSGGLQRLFVANENSSDPGSIQVFAVNAQDPATPLRTIEGPTTLLNNPGHMAAQGGELFVVDRSPSAVHVFSVDDFDDVAPVRSISGINTLLDNATGIAILGNEIYVGNEAAILVFPLDADGDEAPSRVITSVGGMAPSYVSALTSTATPDELMFPTANGGGLVSFSTTAGNTPPALRSFAPLGLGNAVGVASGGLELFVSHRPFGTTGAIMILSDDLNGTLLRNIQGPATQLEYPNGIDVSGGEIFVANTDGGEVLVFDVGADANAAPSRKITLQGPISGEPPNPRCVLITQAQ